MRPDAPDRGPTPSPDRSSRWVRTCRWAAARPVLVGALLLHTGVSLLVWLSGTPLGTYGLECSVGAIGYDLAHGLNPAVPLLDYFDTFTGAYLTEGLLAAPFTVLPWRTIYAVKAGNLVTNAAILLLAWTFLERNVGRLAARVGVVALALGPPVMRHHSLAGPTYHYNELMFDFGMAVLWAEIVLRDRKTWPWYLLFGGLCGFAITNCHGSAGYVVVTLLLWWVCDRGLAVRPRTWTFGLGFLAGLAPLIAKATFHASYHRDVRGLRDFGFTHKQGDQRHLSVMAEKLRHMLDGDYAGALGFLDTLGPSWGFGPAEAFGNVYAGITFLAVPLVLVLAWRAIPAGLVGLLPFKRFAPSPTGARALALAVPAVFAMALVAAYLSSDLHIQTPDPATSQFREDRFLPPLTALLALNLGIAVELVVRMVRRPGRLARELLGKAAVVVAASVGLLLAGVCLVAQLRMVDFDGLMSTEGIPYRGRCYSAEALYAAEVLDGDPARAARFCSGFPESGHGDCYQGFAWSVGIGRAMRVQEVLGEPELPQEIGQSCMVLDPAWQRDCFNQLGWHMQSETIGCYENQEERIALVLEWCGTMPDEERTSWCLGGMGFYYGDHYGFAPHKLESIFPVDLVGEEGQRSIAWGIGYLLGYGYDLEAAAARQCEGYAAIAPGLKEACQNGVVASMETRSRPIPGGAVEPGPI